MASLSLSHFIAVYTLVFLVKHISSKQFYDGTVCESQPQVPGSNYLCNSIKNSCDTFVVYRPQENFQSLSSISSLFNSNQTQLLTFNNLTIPTSHNLSHDREIIIPVKCSCSGRFYQAAIMYNSSGSDTFYMIACRVFEGLLKKQSLIEQNPGSQGEIPDGFGVTVPLRCACPDKLTIEHGVKYLVTYPIVEGENSNLIASKFGVSVEMIWATNSLDPVPTIYPQTTLLVPTKDVPILKYFPARPSPNPRKVIPLKTIASSSASKQKSYIVLGVGVLIVILLLVVAFGLFISIRKRNHQSFRPLSSRSSQLSSFSPDFLDGMSKLNHPLFNFSLEELRIATGDFSEGNMIGSSVYLGRIGDSYLAIEQMSSEEVAYGVIDMLTMINHLNIVKPEGYCSGTTPYLVFEFAANGCLRSCLSNGNVAREFTWRKRMQVAFDIAVGLHYIHYCTSPSYVHRNINSRNILITIDWSAKISGFRFVKSLTCSEEEKEKNNWNESVLVGTKGYLAPEYLSCGLASLKLDIYAFGVVLLELISAKDAIMDGYMLKDSIGFLAEGGLEGSSGCLEKLKEFMDPALEGDYPLGDVLCIAFLAKGCLEENPHQRPNANDVLKALSRIL